MKRNQFFFVLKDKKVNFIRHRKFSLVFLTFVLSSFCLCSQNLSLAWANTMGGANEDRQNSLCIDSCGNVYVTGVFGGNVDFDPGPAVYNLSTGTQASNAYVAKYSSVGSLIWVKHFQGQQWGSTQSIRLDKNGNIGFTGSVNYTVDIDPGPVLNSLGLPNAIGQELFIKLDPAGNLVFGFLLGTGLSDAARLNFDPNGDLIISGTFKNILDLDVGPGTNTVVSVGGSEDFFICRYSSTGNFVWGKKWGGTLPDRIWNIVIDNTGNIITTGIFGNTVDFDPSPSTFTLSSTLGYAFILKINSIGNFVWAGNIGGIAYNSGCTSICVDAANNIYATGHFSNTVDLDPNAATSMFSSNGSFDCFVLKLNPAGTFVSALQIGGPGADAGHCIKVGNNNHIYITGRYQQSVDFDPGILSSFLSAAANYDGFFLELDNSSNFLSVLQLATGTSTASTYLYEFELHGSGSVYLDGYFNGTTDFDPGATVLNKTTVANYDAFLMKLTSCIDAPGWNCQPLKECDGNAVTLVPNGGANLNWYASTSTVSILSGPVFVTPYLSPGTYTYYAEASTCTLANNSAIFIVSVSPLPTIAITPSNANVCIGDKVTFTASGANAYYWNNSTIAQPPTFTAIVTFNSLFSVVGTNTNSTCSNTQTANVLVNVCESIDELNLIPSLKIFPEPCVDELHVQSDLPLRGAIYDELGKIVLSLEIKAGLSNISVSDLVPGIYFLKVEGSNYYSNHKVIKVLN